MKKLFATTALLALAAASGPAFADSSATTNITISGTVDEVCSIPSAPIVHMGATSSAPGVDSFTVTMADLAYPTSALLKNRTVQLEYENVICNYAANVGIGSANGGLRYVGSVSEVGTDDNFATNINYRGLAIFGGAEPSFVTEGAKISDNIPTTGAALGSLIVQIDSMDADGKRLLNGTYSDVITVAVGANV